MYYILGFHLHYFALNLLNFVFWKTIIGATLFILKYFLIFGSGNILFWWSIGGLIYDLILNLI